MLTKRKSGQAARTRLQALAGATGPAPVDRRTFLRRSGLTVGGLAAFGAFQLGTVQKAAEPLGRRIHFCNQDDWALPAIESSLSSALRAAANVREVLA